MIPGSPLSRSLRNLVRLLSTALRGGIPLTFEEKVIGAIGISGKTPQEDEDIAKVGAASAAATIKGGGE